MTCSYFSLQTQTLSNRFNDIKMTFKVKPATVPKTGIKVDNSAAVTEII